MEGKLAEQLAVPPDDPVDHDHQVVGPASARRRRRLPPVSSSQVTHSPPAHARTHAREPAETSGGRRTGARRRGGAREKRVAALKREAGLVRRVATRRRNGTDEGGGVRKRLPGLGSGLVSWCGSESDRWPPPCVLPHLSVCQTDQAEPGGLRRAMKERNRQQPRGLTTMALVPVVSNSKTTCIGR